MIINAVMSNQFKLKFIPGFRTFLFPEKKDIHYIGDLKCFRLHWRGRKKQKQSAT